MTARSTGRSCHVPCMKRQAELQAEDQKNPALPGFLLQRISCNYSVYGTRTSSTRRFCTRPLSVLFEASGEVSPKPTTTVRTGCTPTTISTCATDCVRFCDSIRLYWSPPVLSVWPPTWIMVDLYSFNTSATESSTGLKDSLTFDWLVSKVMLPGILRMMLSPSRVTDTPDASSFWRSLASCTSM